MRARTVAREILTISLKHGPVTLRSRVQRKFSEGRVGGSVHRILRDNLLCSMSTVTRDSRAHINTAYFCHSEALELYFLSDPSSVHCRNLSTNSSMAMTIFSSAQQWGRLDRGMQLFGTCREARGSQAAKAERLYGRRFPLYGQWRTNQRKDDSHDFRYRFYRFVPSTVKLLDEREFGAGVFVVAAVKRARGSK